MCLHYFVSVYRTTKALILMTMTLIVITAVTKLYNLNKNYFTNVHEDQFTYKFKTQANVKNVIPKPIWDVALGGDHDMSVKTSNYLSAHYEKADIPARKYGSFGVLNYMGQQGSGVMVLSSLQCMISAFDLPVRIAEPMFVNSRISTALKKKKGKEIKFSDVFDIEHFNKVSESLGYPLMESRENFLAFAPRDVVYVTFNAEEGLSQPERVVKKMWINAQDVERVDGHPINDKRIEKILDRFNTSAGFNVIKIIEISGSGDDLHSYVMSESELRNDILGGLSFENVTIIFNLWRTLWHIVNHHSRNPHKCLGVGYGSDKEQFYPSPRLLADADRYEKMFLSSGYNVAVMFRIERLLQNVKRSGKQSSVTKCLDEAVNITKTLQEYDQPMITLDLGKFASSTWSPAKGHMTETVKPKISQLFKYDWNLEEWEESFTRAAGGVENKGYIAALQRTLASRADCLVLVGGGSFQDLTMKDYIRTHPNIEDQCIHSVCTINVEYVFTRVKNVQA